MKPGTRVKWVGGGEDPSPEGTVLDFWEATPLHPFNPVLTVQWDAGPIEDDITLDDIEIVA